MTAGPVTVRPTGIRSRFQTATSTPAAGEPDLSSLRWFAVALDREGLRVDAGRRPIAETRSETNSTGEPGLA